MIKVMLASLRSSFTESDNRALLGLFAFFAFFATNVAFASGGGSDLDSAFQGIWEDLIALAEGYGGRILMICMVFAGIYFAIGQPNFIAFAACVVCILILANISTILDTALGANYDALPNISEALTLLKQ
ncbi:hypothetical protein UA32_11690 [Photobacterium angustum]|uniref:Conjugal transfer protein TrbC n=1 Tax=Photobacterium angustum TaxID=661 RepID=A0ABX5H167_PHOAN|nr:hypothetical protein [Photobacterium angustum]KJG37625.1 hypothetical protein UA32_11690 [Photobacterium angustum]PSX07079.1 hypothetical protein C0W27_16040 [Photobacterium angustum]